MMVRKPRLWRRFFSVLTFSYMMVVIGFLTLIGCVRPSGFGLGGRYMEGKREVTKRRGADIDQAIVLLESVVQEYPTYRDSLTFLARAYYAKGRYMDALKILQRALAVNEKDEIAWLVLGLVQLRLGSDEKGLESIKGGLTLLSRAMRNEYRGFPEWDLNRLVASSLRRTVFIARKGLEEKESLIQSTEALLRRIDDEEWYQSEERTRERRLESKEQVETD